MKNKTDTYNRNMAIIFGRLTKYVVYTVGTILAGLPLVGINRAPLLTEEAGLRLTVCS